MLADASEPMRFMRAVADGDAALAANLLAADPRRPNKSGSTAMSLATRNTGRGGTGSPEALAEQAEIIRTLELHGAEAAS